MPTTNYPLTYDEFNALGSATLLLTYENIGGPAFTDSKALLFKLADLGNEAENGDAILRLNDGEAELVRQGLQLVLENLNEDASGEEYADLLERFSNPGEPVDVFRTVEITLGEYALMGMAAVLVLSGLEDEDTSSEAVRTREYGAWLASYPTVMTDDSSESDPLVLDFVTEDLHTIALASLIYLAMFSPEVREDVSALSLKLS
jgi:hypothetical protein